MFLRAKMPRQRAAANLPRFRPTLKHRSDTFYPAIHSSPQQAYKPAEESDAGLSDAGNTHIYLTGGPAGFSFLLPT